MRLQFLGAAGTVTGSKHLFETGSTRILVDCGLFQGYKALRRRNWHELPIPPSSITAVVLTHAHIDHCGWLPCLVRDGFSGPIWCTPPTKELIEIVLPDAARIQEEDARYAKRKGFSRHHPDPQPLFNSEDAARVFPLVRTARFDESFDVGPVRVRFRIAGHILGAASALMETPGGRVVFSGDLGRTDDPLMYDPAPRDPAEWVVMESTYGDREHSDVDLATHLGPVAKDTLDGGGTLLIPSFAIARSQLMLHAIHKLMIAGTIPTVPVYVNSPMATNVTELYVRHHHYHRLDRDEIIEMAKRATYVRTVDESKEVVASSKPKVVISASGMLTGGRVLHHLKRVGPHRKSTIFLPGFQAGGTRGSDLVAGKRSIRVHGQDVDIRCRVEQNRAASGHADRSELLAWFRSARDKPKHVFLVHGEPEASEAFRRLLDRETGVPVDVADALETVSLEG